MSTKYFGRHLNLPITSWVRETAKNILMVTLPVVRDIMEMPCRMIMFHVETNFSLIHTTVEPGRSIFNTGREIRQCMVRRLWMANLEHLSINIMVGATVDKYGVSSPL